MEGRCFCAEQLQRRIEYIEMTIDFLMVSTRPTKRGIIEIYPKFIIKNPSETLMIRGGDFYAIWMEERGLWSTNEQDALDLIDRELDALSGSK